MKTIIAGSRDICDLNLVSLAIQESGFIITEVVSGRAAGVDSLGEYWAIKAGVPVTTFPAEWEAYGKSAGPIRNRKMGDYAEALIAIWDGRSPGTKSMIDYAKKKGLKVFVKTVMTSRSCKSCRP